MAPLLLAAISGLSSLVPEIAGWLKGDKAKERAEAVAEIACNITGIKKPEDAVQAIHEDPELAYKFQEAMLEYRKEVIIQDTKRLQVVNETMQAESRSNSFVQRFWRPFWGIMSALAFTCQIFGLMFIAGWAIMEHPEQAATIIAALATLVSALTVTWTIALSVLGVAVWKRSDDKALAAGVPKIGALTKAVNAIQTIRGKIPTLPEPEPQPAGGGA